MNARLILASASPRRKQLLARLGMPFEVIAPNVSETLPPGTGPEAAAKMLAERKAAAVAAKLRSGIVLGADTLVALDDDIIGKPADREDAARILGWLSGKSQRVITGVCLLDAALGRKLVRAETTWVTMRRMTAAEIAAYVDSGEAMGKAGAYAIQETGDRYVENVAGDFDNAVGLPVKLISQMLAEFMPRDN